MGLNNHTILAIINHVTVRCVYIIPAHTNNRHEEANFVTTDMPKSV